MKFRFEPDLVYQRDAIDAVCSVFDGAPRLQPEQRLFGSISPNQLLLSCDQLDANKKAIYLSQKIKEPCDTEELDFSVEMETGTGKTYVYLRTIFNLHKQYGISKFIIITPNVAVKEGVLQTLAQTDQHFFELFSTRATFFGYTSKKALSQIKNFAETNSLTIMVTNTQAFVGDKAIINSTGRDDTGGHKLSDILAQTRPVIILDEPQVGMDASKTGEAIRLLNPLFKVRYSATHKVVKNLLYQLTPYEAYAQGLVKKIEVLSVVGGGMQSMAHFVFKDVKTGNFAPQAKVEVSVRQEHGYVLKTIYIKDGDSLSIKTKNSMYQGWNVESVTGGMSGAWKVRFSNGKVFELGDTESWDKTAIFREQIRWTVRKHFEKKKKLEPLGIKVLSLFFIDKVDNFIGQEPLIKNIFEQEVYAQEYKVAYGVAPTLSASDAHTSYFARTGDGEFTDNKLSIEKNQQAYDEILRDKASLLALDNPREFIFSHSALGVGWDNPNVFNICTLNESASTTKKRQEIGRGLRLSLNSLGDRVRDEVDTPIGGEINLLTVIANQSYDSFASDYQIELVEDYGANPSAPIKLRNAQKPPTKITRIDDRFGSDKFKNLWARISKQTECGMFFDEDALVSACVLALNELIIQKPLTKLELNRIVSVGPELEKSYGGSDTIDHAQTAVKIDIIDELSEATYLSYRTVCAVMSQLTILPAIAVNPSDFVHQAASMIKQVVDDQLVRYVSYRPIESSLDIDMFLPEYFGHHDPTPVARGLYDGYYLDGDNEKQFTYELDSTMQVKLYVKLPAAYKIPLPNGSTYNPDWAVLIEKTSIESGKESTYHFVVETKGTGNIEDIRPDEKFKILCAIKHFEAIGLHEFIAPVKPRHNFVTKVNQKVDGLL